MPWCGDSPAGICAARWVALAALLLLAIIWRTTVRGVAFLFDCRAASSKLALGMVLMLWCFPVVSSGCVYDCAGGSSDCGDKAGKPACTANTGCLHISDGNCHEDTNHATKDKCLCTSGGTTHKSYCGTGNIGDHLWCPDYVHLWHRYPRWGLSHKTSVLLLATTWHLSCAFNILFTSKEGDNYTTYWLVGALYGSIFPAVIMTFAYYGFSTPCKCLKAKKPLVSGPAGPKRWYNAIWAVRNGLHVLSMTLCAVCIGYSIFFITVNTDVHVSVNSSSTKTPVAERETAFQFVLKVGISTLLDIIIIQNIKAFMWTCYAKFCQGAQSQGDKAKYIKELQRKVDSLDAAAKTWRHLKRKSRKSRKLTLPSNKPRSADKHLLVESDEDSGHSDIEDGLPAAPSVPGDNRNGPRGTQIWLDNPAALPTAPGLEDEGNEGNEEDEAAGPNESSADGQARALRRWGSIKMGVNAVAHFRQFVDVDELEAMTVELSELNTSANEIAEEEDSAPTPLPIQTDLGRSVDDGDLPLGWTGHWDETHQAYYYLHEETEHTTWERPGVTDDADDLGDADCVQRDEEGLGDAQDSGWEARVTEDGETYYTHLRTGASSWVLPDAAGSQEGELLDAGHDPECQVRMWIECVLGIEFESANTQECLRSGVILCNLANSIQPGVIATVSGLSAPFPQRENISKFNKACKELGVPTADLFTASDLFAADGQVYGQVYNCVRALADASRYHGFPGPFIERPRVLSSIDWNAAGSDGELSRLPSNG